MVLPHAEEEAAPAGLERAQFGDVPERLVSEADDAPRVVDEASKASLGVLLFAGAMAEMPSSGGATSVAPATMSADASGPAVEGDVPAGAEAGASPHTMMLISPPRDAPTSTGDPPICRMTSRRSAANGRNVMAATAVLLSTPRENLMTFALPDGRSMLRAVGFGGIHGGIGGRIDDHVRCHRLHRLRQGVRPGQVA